jgi:hypothetical protein
MRLNQSRALSELPGPLKRLHFSTGCSAYRLCVLDSGDLLWS